jgi:biopolymer transport protein ExbD
MKRMGAFNVAPLVGLSRTLTVVFLVLVSPSRGFRVHVAHGMDWPDCGDGGPYVARVLPNGRIRMIDWEVRRGELEERLSSFFRFKVERLLFVEADPSVSFQEVLNVIEIASRQVDHVAVLTPSTKGCPKIDLDPAVDMSFGPRPELKTVPLWPW